MRGEGLHILNCDRAILFINAKHMKMFRFKFDKKKHQNLRILLFRRSGREGERRRPPFQNWNGGKGGPLFINLYLNYYWQTYENVLFQILAKSHNKWRILLFEGVGEGGPLWGKGSPIHTILIIIGKNMKMLFQI